MLLHQFVPLLSQRAHVASALCLNLRPQIERRMELVRLVSHNTHKRLVSCLQGQLGTDSEKRQVRSTGFPLSCWLLPLISLPLSSCTLLFTHKHTTFNRPVVNNMLHSGSLSKAFPFCLSLSERR